MKLSVTLIVIFSLFTGSFYTHGSHSRDPTSFNIVATSFDQSTANARTTHPLDKTPQTSFPEHFQKHSDDNPHCHCITCFAACSKGYQAVIFQPHPTFLLTQHLTASPYYPIEHSPQ